MGEKFYTYAEELPDNIITPVIAEIKLPFLSYCTPPNPLTLYKIDHAIQVTTETYTFPPAIERFFYPALPHLREKFRTTHYNSRMFSLIPTTPHHNNCTHKFGMTYYFDHMIVHHLADEEIYPGQTVRDVLEDIMFAEIYQNELFTDRVKTKEIGLLPNGVGVNMFILTSDDYLIIPQRSKSVAIAPNLYAPSISFGTTYKLLPNPLEENLRDALIREYYYISPKQINAYYLGTYRNLYRLGSPEMYFIMRIPESVDEFNAKLTKEHKKINAYDAQELFTNPEKMAEFFDPDKTSEHVYMLFYLISKYSKTLTKLI